MDTLLLQPVIIKPWFQTHLFIQMICILFVLINDTSVAIDQTAVEFSYKHVIFSLSVVLSDFDQRLSAEKYNSVCKTR